jgi:uncharacterized membrane protein
MFLPLLIVVQWLHSRRNRLVRGYIFLDFILWPILLKLPIQQAKSTHALIARFAGPVMATSGTLVVLLGIIRGTFLGPIQSFDFLFTSSYGITWLACMVLMGIGL